MKVFREILNDLLLIGGFFSLVYGFYQLNHASAWIVGGSLVLFAMSKKYKKDVK